MHVSVTPGIERVGPFEKRAHLVLCIDRSRSMRGEPVAAVVAGLSALARDLQSDPVTARRARVLMVPFGGRDHVEVRPFYDARDFVPSVLTASGTTPMGLAVDAGVDALRGELQRLQVAGIPYARPLLLLISDGEANPGWESAAERCRAAEEAGALTVLPVAVGAANRRILSHFTARGASGVNALDGLDFVTLFLWASQRIRQLAATETEADAK